MIEVETRVKLPFLWGRAVFKKNNWNQVNIMVGPNGSGKTLLAEELGKQFCEKGFQVDVLRSERVNQDELLSKLKEDDSIREKLEGVSDKWSIKTVWGVGYKFETK